MKGEKKRKEIRKKRKEREAKTFGPAISFLSFLPCSLDEYLNRQTKNEE